MKIIDFKHWFVVGVGILVFMFIVGIQKCGNNGSGNNGDINIYKIQEKTYRQPIVKLPFTKSEQPIKSEHLPIFAKKIDKIITIDLSKYTGLPKQLQLIIGKDGRIYKSKDVPDTVTITVTKWKQKVFDIDFKFGYSFVYAGAGYHCLSLNYFRIYNFHIGSEIGFTFNKQENKSQYLIGLSGKLKLGELKLYKIGRLKTFVIGGYDFLGQRIYGGLSISY